MKRIELLTAWPSDNDYQPGSQIEVKDALARKLVKEGVGKMALLQHVYNTDKPMPINKSNDPDYDMPPDLFMPEQERREAREAVAAANKFNLNDQPARAAATAPWRKS